MVKYCLSMLILVFILSQLSWASEKKSTSPSKQKPKTGITVHKAHLLIEPENQSELGELIEANSKVTILSRKRAWYNISSSSNSSGWLNMLNVRFTAAEKREGDLGIGSLFSSVTKSTLPTVSTGVRGFDDVDLANAQANFQQVELLSSYSVSSTEAKAFAQQGQLKIKAITVKPQEQ